MVHEKVFGVCGVAGDFGVGEFWDDRNLVGDGLWVGGQGRGVVQKSGSGLGEWRVLKNTEMRKYGIMFLWCFGNRQNGMDFQGVWMGCGGWFKSN